MAVQLILRDRQKPWSKRISEILTNPDYGFGYIDTSLMGSGKTPVCLNTALKFKLKVFVICPAIAKSVWEEESTKYGVPVEAILSYGELRSIKGKQPTHGYLKRIGEKFTPNEKLVNAVKEGCLIVLDEFQEVRNTTAQWNACHAIVKAMVDNKTISRFAFLSGTPIDKKPQVVNLLKLANFIEDGIMFRKNPKTGKVKIMGIGRLIDTCRKINPEKTAEIIEATKLSRENIAPLAWDLYTQILKDKISGSMPAPDNIEGNLDAKNGFYKIKKENQKLLREGIELLSKSLRWDKDNSTVQFGAHGFGKITKALEMIEKAKLDDLIRVVTKVMKNKNARVVISVNYIHSIKYLKKFFPDAATLTGETKNRAKIIKDFKNNKIPLLIKTSTTGQSAISLHDTDGHYPRYMFIIPNYSFITIAQNVMRIYRDGTMSDATVRLFYGKGAFVEERTILAAMSRKTEVLKGMINEENLGGIKYPGDYEDYVEE